MVKTGKAELNLAENCTIQNKMKLPLRLSTSSFLCLIVAGASTALATNANAETIVSDSLTYVGTDSSYGGANTRELASAPTPVGATSGWIYGTGAPDYTRYAETPTGTFQSNADDQASLKVPTLVAGNIYTLSIDEHTSSLTATSSGPILYVGFEALAPGYAGTNRFFSPGPAGLEMGSTGGVNLNTSDGQVAGSSNHAINGNGGPNLLTLTLNTEASQWTITASVNGFAEATHMYTANPTGLNSIYFDINDDPDVYFSNISLTGVGSSFSVPEPATFAYLLSALALLGVCLRRKQCRV